MEKVMAVSKGMNQESIELIKSTICKGATDTELQMFLMVCNRTGLDPLARQIFAVKRWSSKAGKEEMQIQTSIDGFRLIAERTGKYAGQLGPYWCGEDGVWKEVWLKKEHPMASKIGILRKDFAEPLYAVATWEEYCPKDKQGVPVFMWQKLGPVMIAKCAESLGLRRSFPQELSGLYSQEEMAQAEVVQEVHAKPSFVKHETTETVQTFTVAIDPVKPVKEEKPKEVDPINAKSCTEEQIDKITSLILKTSKPAEWSDYVCKAYKVDVYSQLSSDDANKIIKLIEEGLASKEEKEESKDDPVDNQRPETKGGKPISQKQIDFVNKLGKHYKDKWQGKLSVLLVGEGAESLEKCTSHQASNILKKLTEQVDKDRKERKADDINNP